MADIDVDSDRFGASIEQLLGDVGSDVEESLPKAIQRGIRKGASAWRKNAKREFKEGRTYRKHGQTYQIGAYVKSIRSHMLVKDGPKPSGEVGSPKMPGLPHLLEEGHARIGGGRVRAIVHIAPAANEAFDATMRYVDEEIGRALS